jgi:voltage-gated potassium channel
MDERVARAERRFEWPVLVSALLVIPAIAIEQSSLDQPWDTIATVINWATWLVFLAELVVMLIVAPNRWQWLRRHPLELPLVVFTPPILPPGLQALRALRVLRLVRLERVARYFRKATSPDGLQFAGLVAILAAVGGGLAFEVLERHQPQKPTFFEGFWWAMSTMTTVGYGDFVPVTTGGRILAMVLMIIGIGFVALLTGAIAQRFISSEVKHVERELDTVQAEENEIAIAISEIRVRLDHLEAMLRRPG